MRSKTSPADTKIANQQNMWNLRKTSIFTMFSAYADIGIRSHSVPKSLKKTSSKSSCNSDPQNQQNVTNMSQKHLQKGHQNHPKTNKIEPWAPGGLQECPCGHPIHQNASPGSQNRESKSSKSQIWQPKSTQSTLSTGQPVSQSAVSC